MSAAEITCRLGRVWRERRERRDYRQWLHRGRTDQPAMPAFLPCSDGLRTASSLLIPGTRKAELDRLHAEWPETFARFARSARCQAEAVLSGRRPMLGYEFDLRQPIEWHRDPRSQYAWPHTFYADVPLSPNGNVDVKYVWELGRQRYLVELARGWLFTREEGCANRARDLMLSFIQQNPLYEGVHWTSALEVAVRAISWIWTVATLAEWDGWQPGELERIAASLAQHGTYLEHHFSLHSSPYNHLIGEATALYLVGTALEHHEQATAWRCHARRALAEYGPRQFHPDGFCVEQATGYHFYTLGFLSLALAAARTSGEPWGDLERVVHRAYGAGAAFQQPDGRWPAIGDVDSARSVPVDHDDFWDFRSLVSLGAVLFEDPQLKASSGEPGEELFWLLGCAGIETWHELPQKPAPAHVVLKESGYAVASGGGTWLLFDAGPIAAGLHADGTPSTAHGHADALQVLFCLEGRPVLVDAGMPFYLGPAPWLRHFRGPAAHNTLEVEGVEMARHAGNLDWSHVARRPDLDASLSNEIWLARGRVEWSPGVVIQRNLLAHPGQGLWIADYVQSDRPRRVRWFWQLPAGMLERVDERDSGTCLITGHGISLATWCTAGPLRTKVEAATEDSPVGWNATGYGLRRKAQRVCQEAQVVSQLLVATHVGDWPAPTEVIVGSQHLWCATADSDPSLSLELAKDGQQPAASVLWRLDTDGGRSTYLAGLPRDEDASDWTRLVGTGGWSVWRQRSKDTRPVHTILGDLS